MRHTGITNKPMQVTTHISCDGPDCDETRDPTFGRSGWCALLDDRLPHALDFHDWACLRAYVEGKTP